MEPRAEVLALFRRCLRTAKRCPAHQHQVTYTEYAKIKFRAGRSWRDNAQISAGFLNGLDECERMEYFQRAKGLLKPLVDAGAGTSELAAPTTSVGRLEVFLLRLDIPEKDVSTCEFSLNMGKSGIDSLLVPSIAH